jgi:hypothetical protein
MKKNKTMDNVPKHNCINVPPSETCTDYIVDALRTSLFVYVTSPHGIPHKAFSVNGLTILKQ